MVHPGKVDRLTEQSGGESSENHSTEAGHRSAKGTSMRKSSRTAARRRGGLSVRVWAAIGLVVLLFLTVLGVALFGAATRDRDLVRALLQYIGAPLVSVLIGAAGLRALQAPPPPPVPALAPRRRRGASGKSRRR